MREMLKGAALGLMGCTVWLILPAWRLLSTEQRDMVGGAIMVAVTVCITVVCAAAGGVRWR